MWITSREFRKKYNITPQHLYALKKQGKIETKNSVGSMYLIKDGSDDEREVCIYGRVSTSKQTTDLENQMKLLREYCVAKGYNPSVQLSDIGSGMNENRKGLNSLLDLVVKEKVSRIVITHKDRLARFGFGYIEGFCNRFGTVIEIVNAEDDKSFQGELTEDFIAIIHHFSMRFYGRRRNVTKDMEKSLKIVSEDEDK